MASFRLNKVAKDFNVGIQTLVEYLAKKGHQVESSPNTKISEEQYELLAKAFHAERMVKQEADKIELMASGANRVVEVASKAEPDVEAEEVVIKGYTATMTPQQPKADEEPAPVVADGNVITGQAPGTAVLFGLVVLQTLVGDRVSQKVAREMVSDALG